jgi:DNA-directed RNA polymerase subunit M/transcription elongation factor TFIIS
MDNSEHVEEAHGSAEAAGTAESKLEAKEAVRKFVRAPVEIETIGGRPLVYRLWVSNEKPSARRKHASSGTKEAAEAARSEFKCEVCGKVFNENKKLLLHSRYHRKESSNDVFTCSVCGKSFDEQRKLLLHARYHKEVRKPRA